ncbi:S8 family serine peptidase [Nonomuraea sp. NPDC048826]|uniref:S8 family serine peptidase n=1 Tax=Nonomuraea sp. NPDC048826 TaxID=3364347 RepID=UPI00371124EA
MSHPLPEIVHAQAAPRPAAGVSPFALVALTADRAAAAVCDDAVVIEAAARLQAAGFTVRRPSSTSINISGPPDLYERAFGCRLTTAERRRPEPDGHDRDVTFVECEHARTPGLIATEGTGFAGLLAGVAIEEPRFLCQSPAGPATGYWHLSVPADVAHKLRADTAHQSRNTGTDVRVALVDSGYYRHPYFTGKGYKPVTTVLAPGSANPAADEYGHGTAMAALILAVAPKAQLTVVKSTAANTIEAFKTAVAQSPHVICFSWAGNNVNGPLSGADILLADEIAQAVANGIAVVCPAGNGQHAFPGQHPDVISVGGAHLDEDGNLRASDYASGFTSAIFPGRQVPDVAGLVGLRPNASYIMLPTQPGSDLDQVWFGRADGTKPDDGWAVFSGTSAAAAQTAGVCALIRSSWPGIRPRRMRKILKSTARDVTAGRGYNAPGMNHAAAVGADDATGSGLVDADAAQTTARTVFEAKSIRSGVRP